MALVLALRLSVKKNDKGPDHLLDKGIIWNDAFNGPSTGQDFLGYSKNISEEVDDFYYCTDRDFGPDRTKIALAPEGNPMITEIKNAIEYDLNEYGWTDLTVELYSSRDAIMDIISDSNYEKDGVPGI